MTRALGIGGVGSGEGLGASLAVLSLSLALALSTAAFPLVLMSTILSSAVTSATCVVGGMGD